LKQAPQNEEQREREYKWPIAPPTPSDLPDGEYLAAFRGGEPGQWFGQQKIRLRFEIFEPAAYAGIEVLLFATLPNRPSPRHKYYDLWVRANGGPPHRNDRMSPRAFRGYWRVRIAWSVPKNGGHPMPQVMELLERTVGGRSS